MTNIEQIKKDWEAHCKEYGCRAYIEYEFGGLALTIEEFKDDDSGVFIEVLFDNNPLDLNTVISTRLSLSNYYNKLFTTFYEKLMKEQEND